jgi:hypothetical protein
MYRLIVAIVVSIALWNNAGAFHYGGVAECNGCHTLHNSIEGFPADPGNPGGNQWLLISARASDVCLSCHANENGAVLGTNPLAPPPERGAGNFVFLLEDNLNDAPNGALNPISGRAAGHNIDAPANGLSVDGTTLTAPGGSFPSNMMGCTSCHDPHGNTNFRFLYGAGPIPGNGETFVNPAPAAVGIDLKGEPESNSNHTAYLSGMSAWCANCHTTYLGDHGGSFGHPTSGHLDGSIMTQYNIYNGTDNPSGGNAATAYLAAVPLEGPDNGINSTIGASSSSEITCLTCHRAHASSAPYAGRWDFNVALLSQDGIISGSYPIPNPYLSPTQTGLCYKCHPSGSG